MTVIPLFCSRFLKQVPHAEGHGHGAERPAGPPKDGTESRDELGAATRKARVQLADKVGRSWWESLMRHSTGTFNDSWTSTNIGCGGP